MFYVDILHRFSEETHSVQFSKETHYMCFDQDAPRSFA